MNRKVYYAFSIILLLSLLVMLPISPSFARNDNNKLYVTVKDLGTLPGGTISLAEAINNKGQVVGGSEVSDRVGHAFLWTAKGGMIDLGTLPGAGDSWAAAINNKGQVVGYSGQIDETGAWVANWPRAFLWTAEGEMIELGTLPGGIWSFATGINDKGEVVGYSDRADGRFHAFLWTAEGGMIDLGTLPGAGESWATAINNKGEVVGTSRLPGMYQPLVLWTAKDGMIELGTLPGGIWSFATGINDKTEVVGASFAVGVVRAFLWTAKEGWIDLGTLPGGIWSFATGINDKGEVVGYSGQMDETGWWVVNSIRAFLWTSRNGLMELEGLPGTTPTFASDINDDGQIVGWSGAQAVLWETKK